MKRPNALVCKATRETCRHAFGAFSAFSSLAGSRPGSIKKQKTEFRSQESEFNLLAGIPRSGLAGMGAHSGEGPNFVSEWDAPAHAGELLALAVTLAATA